MSTLNCLLYACAFTALFRAPLKKAPWVFYVLAAAFDVLCLFSTQLHMPKWFISTFVLADSRALFAFGLFTIVMFLGVLENGSYLKKRYLPIRAELSILGAILTVGHLLRFFQPYLFRAMHETSSSHAQLLISFAIAVIVLALLVVLTVTSFRIVRKAMPRKTWKAIQTSAYAFYILLFVHVFMASGPTALRGKFVFAVDADGGVTVSSVARAFSDNVPALFTLALYAAIAIAYVVLRVRRAKLDAAQKAPEVEAAAE